MADSLSLSDIIPASPEAVFKAWLDAEQHGAMTGSTATDEGDGRFTAWDGYITGRTVSAVPHTRIVQAWRTSEFPEGEPDSMLTISFFAAEHGHCKVELDHQNLPTGQGPQYEKGWNEFYFEPMKRHFGGNALEQMKDTLEDVLEDARSQARETVKAVKKVQKQASAAIKKVSKQVQKKVKALVGKKKKPSGKRAKKKTAARPKVAKKPARKKGKR